MNKYLTKRNLIIALAGVISLGLAIWLNFSTSTNTDGYAIKKKLFLPLPVKISDGINNADLYGTGGDIIYYRPADEGFYRLNTNTGKNRTICTNILGTTDQIDNIAYSKNKAQNVVFATDEITNENKVYLVNLQKCSKKLLDNKIQTASWSPDDSQVAFLYQGDDSDHIYLGITNPDWSGEQKIADLPNGNYSFDWKNGNELLYWVLPSDNSSTDINLINITNKQSKMLIPDVSPLIIEINSNGNKLLTQDVKTNEIKIYNFEGDNIGSGYGLGIKELRPSSAVWLNDSKDVLATISNSNGVSEVWLVPTENKKRIVKIEVKNQDINLNFENMIVSNDNKTLFGISDAVLYKLKLR